MKPHEEQALDEGKSVFVDASVGVLHSQRELVEHLVEHGALPHAERVHQVSVHRHFAHEHRL